MQCVRVRGLKPFEHQNCYIDRDTSQWRLHLSLMRDNGMKWHLEKKYHAQFRHVVDKTNDYLQRNPRQVFSFWRWGTWVLVKNILDQCIPNYRVEPIEYNEIIRYISESPPKLHLKHFQFTSLTFIKTLVFLVE